MNKNKSGVVWSKDIGLFELNDYYHEKPALDKGLDIHTTAGNLTYGLELVKEEGTKPWAASKSCWS